MSRESWNPEELVTNMIRHGARKVEMKDLFREGVSRAAAHRPMV